jgi:surface antigen
MFVSRRSAHAVLAVPMVALAVVTASCTELSQGVQNNPKAVLGTLGGAALGGGIAALAGGGTGAIVGATLGGALLGGVIGNRLDARDKQLATQAAQQAFENSQTGKPTVWNNPDTGNSGTITPTRTYQLANGTYCRQYQQTIMVGGQQEQAYGTACRQPDGSWGIQS